MKLSVRSHRMFTRSLVAVVFAGTSCAGASLVTAGTAAAVSTARPAAVHAAPSAATARAGGRIAFSQWDLLPGGNLTGHSNVYTINPNGTGRRQLTHVSTAHAAGAPDWSADGRKIVYESNQSGDYRIWAMNANGSSKRRLTNDPGFADLEPAWSPDGNRILFSRCDDHLGFIADCDLEVMNAKDTGMRKLASGHWTWLRGEFSPDGRHIVVGADKGGLLSALWVLRADGTGLRRITRPSLQAFWPGWSPDGRRIIFTDNCCQSGSNIWTVRPSGKGLRELTHLPPQRQVGFASYSPDGRRIVLLPPETTCCQSFAVMNADGSGLHSVHTGVPNTFLTDWGRRAG